MLAVFFLPMLSLTPASCTILPNLDSALISMPVDDQSPLLDSALTGTFGFLVPVLISCAFLIPQATFYHLAAFYELIFLAICVDFLVCAHLAGSLSGFIFVLFVISLTTLESVILLSYLVYRSSKTSVAALRDTL